MYVENDTDRIFWLVSDALLCHVTSLSIPPHERPYELSYRGNLQRPVEFKIVRTEK